MSISIPSVLIGCGIVGIGYFLYLCATKGIPAAWAWIKAKFSSVEGALVADFQKDIATLKTDMAAVKAKVGL